MQLTSSFLWYVAPHLKRMVTSNLVNLIQSSYIAVPNSPFIVMGDVTSHKKGLEYS
jgi:hypothetical protein